jgi:hypothetical protein
MLKLSHRLMKRMTSGHLRVLTYSNIYVFPSGRDAVAPNESTRKAELRVANDVFWIRLCVMGDLGFAEAYMYGDVECDDLVSLFHVKLLPPHLVHRAHRSLCRYFWTTDKSSQILTQPHAIFSLSLRS